MEVSDVIVEGRVTSKYRKVSDIIVEEVVMLLLTIEAIVEGVKTNTSKHYHLLNPPSFPPSLPLTILNFLK